MKKIARGTTGQANLKDTSPIANPLCSPTNAAGIWFIKLNPSPIVGMNVPTNAKNGWELSEAGIVQVPPNATGGTYTASFGGERGAECGPYIAKQTTYEFEVVCITVEISVTETFRDATKFRLSCTAIRQGGTAPFTYNWTVNGGTLQSGQGTTSCVAEFNVGATGSINLSVQDSSNPACTDSDTFAIAPSDIVFTVSTDPASGDSGTDNGQSRDAKEFTVEVLATANVTVNNPPATITFQFQRPATGEIYQLTAGRFGTSNPPQYNGIWTVTKVKGRWNITVEHPHTSNTAVFKVNKRKQIVAVATGWTNVSITSCNNLPYFNACDGFVSYIYRKVGLSSSALIGGPNLSQVQTDTGDGAILFFSLYGSSTAGAAHVGIVDGSNRIDNNYTNNCENNPPTQRDEDEGVGDWYDAPFSGSPIDPISSGLLLDAD